MTGLFNQVAGVFKGLFSRSFWLAYFGPVMLAIVVHIVMAALVFHHFGELLAWVRATLKNDLAEIPLLVIGVVILAYALGPLSAVLRSVLDASILPEWLYKGLRWDRLQLAYAAQKRIDEAYTIFGFYSNLEDNRLKKLVEANVINLKYKQRRDRDETLFRAGISAMENFSGKVLRGYLPQSEEVDQYFIAIRLALLNRSPPSRTAEATEQAEDKAPGAQNRVSKTIGGAYSKAVYGQEPAEKIKMPQDPKEQARQLDTTFGQFTIAVKRATQEGLLRIELLKERYGSLASDPTPRATRMADARASAESYSKVRYNVSFAFLWPRLTLLRAASTPIDPVADSQAQVDFSVMTFFLLATVPIVWLPILASTATTPWPFLALAGGSPVVCGLVYELCIAAQENAGHVIKGVIDKNRLDVLASLNQAHPTTLENERKTWNRLEIYDQGGDGADLIYRYTTQ